MSVVSIMAAILKDESRGHCVLGLTHLIAKQSSAPCLNARLHPGSPNHFLYFGSPQRLQLMHTERRQLGRGGSADAGRSATRPSSPL
jgi:hypothetical protein